jgi:hypothetical protein
MEILNGRKARDRYSVFIPLLQDEFSKKRQVLRILALGEGGGPICIIEGRKATEPTFIPQLNI